LALKIGEPRRGLDSLVCARSAVDSVLGDFDLLSKNLLRQVSLKT
jgi:hypothetical protein